jgi:hypothetical protein
MESNTIVTREERAEGCDNRNGPEVERDDIMKSAILHVGHHYRVVPVLPWVLHKP